MSQDGPSPEFAATLKSSGKAMTDSGKFYTLKYTISESKRKQTVYIRKSPETYLSLKGHEVFGLVWEGPTEPTAEKLLEWSQRRFGVGGLVCERPSETQTQFRVRYRLTVADSATAAELTEALEIVAATSDDVEKVLNPGAEDHF